MHRNADGKEELGPAARFVAAGGASTVSAVVVNPFDVVKTRLQAQAAAQTTQASGAPNAASQAFREACDSACSPSQARHGTNCNNFSSTLDGLTKITRREGFRALWRGLDTSLLMAVPSVGVYMPLYDILIKQMDGVGSGKYIAAGALARTVSVLIIAPLDLVRTRTQAYFHPMELAANGAGTSSSTWTALNLAASELGVLGRFRLLWRGVGATLSRDVPFSAIYWGMLEPIRGAMLRTKSESPSSSRLFAANLTAGAVGGAIASAMTQPLDVVKTRMQLDQERSQGTLRTLISIGQKEGLRGLFTGVTPRAMKATPACAIVLASYECMKSGLVKPNES